MYMYTYNHWDYNFGQSLQILLLYTHDTKRVMITKTKLSASLRRNKYIMRMEESILALSPTFYKIRITYFKNDVV